MVVCASPWVVGWAVGVADPLVTRLWRRHRQAAALCTQQGDDIASRHIDAISFHIDAQSTSRLSDWRARVRTRSGASAWLKFRCHQASNACLPVNWGADISSPIATRPIVGSSWAALPLSPNDMQCITATEFTTRWNAGLRRHPRCSTLTTWLSTNAIAVLTTDIRRPHCTPIVVPPLH